MTDAARPAKGRATNSAAKSTCVLVRTFIGDLYLCTSPGAISERSRSDFFSCLSCQESTLFTVHYQQRQHREGGMGPQQAGEIVNSVFQEWAKPLVRYAICRLRNREIAEEIVQ